MRRRSANSVPDAEIAFDPFHVVPTRAAAPPTRSAATNGTPTSAPTPLPAAGSRTPAGRCSRHRRTRRSYQLARLGEVQHANRALYRAFLLREELRLLYHLPDRALAPAHLDAWLAWASRSRLTPFVRLARTIRRHREGIPRRHPPRTVQRTPRRPQQPHPPDQPPQLRLPYRRPPDRTRLPLLQRHRHRPPAVNFTTKPTGAPFVVDFSNGSAGLSSPLSLIPRAAEAAGVPSAISSTSSTYATATRESVTPSASRPPTAVTRKRKRRCVSESGGRFLAKLCC